MDLSHEMKLQYTGGLDFIFNEIGYNSALEISDQSSKVKVGHTEISHIFCTCFRELQLAAK